MFSLIPISSNFSTSCQSAIPLNSLPRSASGPCFGVLIPQKACSRAWLHTAHALALTADFYSGYYHSNGTFLHYYTFHLDRPAVRLVDWTGLWTIVQHVATLRITANWPVKFVAIWLRRVDCKCHLYRSQNRLIMTYSQTYKWISILESVAHALILFLVCLNKHVGPFFATRLNYCSKYVVFFCMLNLLCWLSSFSAPTCISFPNSVEERVHALSMNSKLDLSLHYIILFDLGVGRGCSAFPDSIMQPYTDEESHLTRAHMSRRLE